MAISAYNKKMKYTSLSDSGVGFLDEAESGGGLGTLVANCKAIGNVEGQACGAERELTPRVSCEWVQ